MAIRVWIYAKTSTTGGVYHDYQDASAYRVDNEHELDVVKSNGDLIATFAPGCWKHVEMVAPKS